MRFAQDSASSINIIRAYGEGELRINDEIFRTAMIVGAAAKLSEPLLNSTADLTAEHAARIMELQPEVVLLGTGRRQVFPDPAFSARFLAAGVGFEAMDTGAACRTFNVLVGEQRRVVALLLV